MILDARYKGQGSRRKWFKGAKVCLGHWRMRGGDEVLDSFIQS